MSSDWSSKILLEEVVANSSHINSLVPVQLGMQLSQLMVACYLGDVNYVEAFLKISGIKLDIQND